MWHSHAHEVRSGALIAPGIPRTAEHELMSKLAGTYGKTWHTWHTDQERELPVGGPMLMMGFTADGQANAAMVADRDRRFELASTALRAHRADMRYREIDPDADAWSRGIVMQVQVARAKESGETTESPSLRDMAAGK